MLLPTPADDIDSFAVYTDPHRAPVGDRPWVLVNMITTVDGATADAEGRSAGLGGPADREVFTALRGVADVIVAGAGTVRAEDYGPARISAERQRDRVKRGQAPRPRIAVVSGSLDLDPAARLFADPGGPRPIVITSAASDPAARRRLAGGADLIVTGDEALDWPAALRELRRTTGAGVALVEGGPTVNGHLLADDLVDEMCLTIAPGLAGGTSHRAVRGGAHHELRRATLAHALEDDGFLLLRYVTRRAAGSTDG
jgi:riboflavin-specific deaminase-like protein